jgi:general secretion pathway protein K
MQEMDGPVALMRLALRRRRGARQVGATVCGCESGFALPIVLFCLAFLSVIVMDLAATGRREAKLAQNLRNAAAAEAAADGATFQAIVQLMAGAWSAGPMQHVVQIGGALVTVRIEDSAHLVNPNNAPVSLLAALLYHVGVAPQSAQVIAASIVAYRDQSQWDPTYDYIAAGLPYGPARHNFRSVAELRSVLGITPELYERLAIHMSVWKSPIVVPGPEDPVVAAAYVDAGPNGGFGQLFSAARLMRGRPLRLDARISTVANVGGAQFSRLAEVELHGPASAPMRPYSIMEWGRPGD